MTRAASGRCRWVGEHDPTAGTSPPSPGLHAPSACMRVPAPRYGVCAPVSTMLTPCACRALAPQTAPLSLNVTTAEQFEELMAKVTRLA